MRSKVFISWSGELSKKLAEQIRDWLPDALHSVEPFYSQDDTRKGSHWFTEIAKQLEDANVGIICLTKYNLNKPWLLFEAGALSKNFDKSLVCPILFGIENQDVKGPLASFQTTKFNKPEFKKLFALINNTCGEYKLDSDRMSKSFENWWPKLESKINEILEDSASIIESNLQPNQDHLQLSNFGVVGIEETVELKTLKENIKLSNNRIDMLDNWICVNLWAFSLRTEIIKALSRGVELRVMLLDPSSPFATRRSLDLRRSRDYVSNSIKKNILELKMIAEEAEKTGANFKFSFRLSSNLPSIEMQLFDDKLIFGNFLDVESGFNPHIVVHNNKTDKSLFRVLSRHFNSVFNASENVIFEYGYS